MKTGDGHNASFDQDLRDRELNPLLMACHVVSGEAKQQDLTKVNLEDLMNIEVTSVAKRAQKLSQTASAVFVITREDIERAGVTNIPDLLRMVPGTRRGADQLQ